MVEPGVERERRRERRVREPGAAPWDRRTAMAIVRGMLDCSDASGIANIAVARRLALTLAIANRDHRGNGGRGR